MSCSASHLPASAAAAASTPLRLVAAASLFDGNVAAIDNMRRLIQAQGAEVIHLGHNRCVEDAVCRANEHHVAVQCPAQVSIADESLVGEIFCAIGASIRTRWRRCARRIPEG